MRGRAQHRGRKDTDERSSKSSGLEWGHQLIRIAVAANAGRGWILSVVAEMKPVGRKSCGCGGERRGREYRDGS